MIEERVIDIPSKLNNDYTSLEWLAELAGDTILSVNEQIIFDFQNCSFFAGNLCAILGGVINGLQERSCRVYFKNLPSRIRGFLKRNQFLRGFLNESIEDIDETTIAFAAFKVEDENEVKLYVEKQLLGKKVMPLISEALKKEMIKSIFEIYVNALTHGKCAMIFSCGQQFLKGKKKELHFTIVDLGVTIKSNVASFLGRNITGIESIEWATSENNSTKTQNHSGGLGLKLIQKFIRLNAGAMQIVSDNGIWELSKNRISSTEMLYSFPGTIVTLIFNLNDFNQYSLASETTTFDAF